VWQASVPRQFAAASLEALHRAGSRRGVHDGTKRRLLAAMRARDHGLDHHRRSNESRETKGAAAQLVAPPFEYGVIDRPWLARLRGWTAFRGKGAQGETPQGRKRKRWPPRWGGRGPKIVARGREKSIQFRCSERYPMLQSAPATWVARDPSVGLASGLLAPTPITDPAHTMARAHTITDPAHTMARAHTITGPALILTVRAIRLIVLDMFH
jgi:hypothetical protein